MKRLVLLLLLALGSPAVWLAARAEETHAESADGAEFESHAEGAENAEPRPGEAGPLPEGAAERSEAGGISHAETAEPESHAETAEPESHAETAEH